MFGTSKDQKSVSPATVAQEEILSQQNFQITGQPSLIHHNAAIKKRQKTGEHGTRAHKRLLIAAKNST